jgi:hypothetical protein
VERTFFEQGRETNLGKHGSNLHPAYFLTVFILKKWAVKKIDKLRRSFLRRGAAEANGGHFLVRWAKVLKPKKSLEG